MIEDLRVAADSLLSWCSARHRNTPEQKRELDALVMRLRGPRGESEPQRTNRIMREVLTDHLDLLEIEARRAGWLS